MDKPKKRNLFKLLDRRDVKELKAALKNLKSIDFLDPKTTLPPITYAVEIKWIEGLRVLIEAGANVNFQRTPYDNALVAAVRLGQVEMVEMLLNAGANPNGIRFYDFEPDSPLNLAIKKENKEILNLLIEAGADVNAPQNINGTAPLTLAIYRGNLDLVTTLIEAGAFVDEEISVDFSNNDYDEIKETNILIAAKSGYQNIVEYLLPLVPCEEDRLRAIEELPKAIARKQEQMKMQDLIVAASTGDIKTVEALIEEGIDVNGVAFNQKTALCEACFYGKFEIVRILIDAGATLDKSSFVNVIYRNRSNIVKFLIEAGFNFSQFFFEGYTALMLAAKNDCFDTVKVLLESGIKDVNAKNFDQKTALDLARDSKHREVVRLLKEYGAVGDSEIEETTPSEDIPF
ncbi:ankyrin repeat domain-containing protein [Baaleninema simplex]|uniref:ankyrin repeat domain-containing protein n=1 Tax=Baaleninema simplex TaxID=2862350 RepID=UPI00034B41C6|nr:ankyrin repeat domain-containing protein [Baaleninema simplex]